MQYDAYEKEKMGDFLKEVKKNNVALPAEYMRYIDSVVGLRVTP